MPFWWVRTFAGLLIIAGQGLLFYALWATARQPSVEAAASPVPAAAS
jgi:hypothetical protein